MSDWDDKSKRPYVNFTLPMTRRSFSLPFFILWMWATGRVPEINIFPGDNGRMVFSKVRNDES